MSYGQDPRSPEGDQGPHDCDRDYTGEVCGNPLFHLPSIRSNDRRWPWFPEVPSVDYCGAAMQRGFDRAKCRHVTYSIRCDSMRHQKCAEKRVARDLKTLGEYWQHLEAVTYVGYQSSTVLDDRVRQRRRGGNWYRIERSCGYVHQFAIQSLTGYKPPYPVGLSPELAIYVAVEALALPGVVGLMSSSGWKRKKRPGYSTVTHYGPLSDYGWRLARGQAAAMIFTLLGIRIDPEDDIPDEVADLWIEVLGEAVEDVRISRQALDDEED